MNTKHQFALAALFAANLALPAFAQTDSAEELARQTIHRRAVEAVIWGMPAVNFQRMKQAMLDTKGAPNQVVYWSRPVNWKDQTLTPNPIRST